MLDGKLKTFLAVAAYGGNVWVVFDVIVIEYRGDGGRRKLLHPGVQKGHAENERSMVPSLHHKNVVRRHLLEVYIDGDNIYRPTFRFRHLFETQYNIMAELVGSVVIHIFDQDT